MVSFLVLKTVSHAPASILLVFFPVALLMRISSNNLKKHSSFRYRVQANVHHPTAFTRYGEAQGIEKSSEETRVDLRDEIERILLPADMNLEAGKPARHHDGRCKWRRKNNHHRKNFKMARAARTRPSSSSSDTVPSCRSRTTGRCGENVIRLR